MLGKALRGAFTSWHGILRSTLFPRILPGLLITTFALQVLGTGAHAAQVNSPQGQGTRAGETVAPLEPGSTPLILELRDSALIAKVWNLVYPDSALPSGEYQILLPYGPELVPDGQDAAGEAFLLRNGTEVGRVERAAWQQIAAAAKKDGEEPWSSSNDGANRQEVPLLWKALHWDTESLLAWAEWPAGLLVGVGSEFATLPGAKPQFQRDIDFAWSQKLYRHYLLGLELHRSQFGGGLTRMALEAEAVGGGNTGLPINGTPAGIPFWGDAYWWWAVSVGVPGLKYTLSLADQPLPQYYWLDPSATAAVKGRMSGRMVNQWTGTTLAKQGNFAHTLDARLGYFRYGLHFDSDAYSFPVQTVGLDELPAPFGNWGGGLIMASNIIATRLMFDIPDLAVLLPFPQAYASNFRLAFLRMELDYRSIRNFNLGVSVRIHLDNPIMNRPGA